MFMLCKQFYVCWSFFLILYTKPMFVICSCKWLYKSPLTRESKTNTYSKSLYNCVSLMEHKWTIRHSDLRWFLGPGTYRGLSTGCVRVGCLARTSSKESRSQARLICSQVQTQYGVTTNSYKQRPERWSATFRLPLLLFLFTRATGYNKKNE